MAKNKKNKNKKSFKVGHSTPENSAKNEGELPTKKQSTSDAERREPLDRPSFSATIEDSIKEISEQEVTESKENVNEDIVRELDFGGEVTVRMHPDIVSVVEYMQGLTLTGEKSDSNHKFFKKVIHREDFEKFDEWQTAKLDEVSEAYDNWVYGNKSSDAPITVGDYLAELMNRVIDTIRVFTEEVSPKG